MTRRSSAASETGRLVVDTRLRDALRQIEAGRPAAGVPAAVARGRGRVRGRGGGARRGRRRPPPTAARRARAAPPDTRAAAAEPRLPQGLADGQASAPFQFAEGLRVEPADAVRRADQSAERLVVAHRPAERAPRGRRVSRAFPSRRDRRLRVRGHGCAALRGHGPAGNVVGVQAARRAAEPVRARRLSGSSRCPSRRLQAHVRPHARPSGAC